jgi:Uma2 family endonuclease
MSDPRRSPPEQEHPLANYPKPPPRGEDLPWDDGEPMESERHGHQMDLLIESLLFAWRDREDFYVAGNMFLYFSEAQSRKNDFRGPDVFVVLDTIKRERKSWVVWEENGRTPNVVIELLSPSTERVDRGEKMKIYARVLRVPAYYLYDPFTHVLEGYSLDEEQLSYRRLSPDEQGRLRCAPLGLSLGLVECEYRGIRIPWLRWIDPAGRPLFTHGEWASLRADEETQRADEEKRRADEEKRRADEEKRRADELAARLAQYERDRDG